MKITTWNVNGLRALLSKNGLDNIKTLASDVICMQEIKARPEQLSDEQLKSLEPYNVVWNPAERGGYSGVATMTKEGLIHHELGFNIPEYDVEGRVIQSRFEGFRLFNIYFPNGQRDQNRLTYKMEFYESLLYLLDQLHERGENIIICGDFNTAHKEIDLRNPKENEMNSGFLPEERVMLDKYLDHGFVDVFRYMYPEQEQYTWWTYRFNARIRNIGWRIDYFYVSEPLIERVKDIVIHDEIMGSDHCPMTLEIE